MEFSFSPLATIMSLITSIALLISSPTFAQANSISLDSMRGAVVKFQSSPPRGSVEIDTSDLAEAEDAVKRLINDRANSIFRELEFLSARDASDLVVSIKVKRVGATRHDPNYRADLVATIDGVPVKSGQASVECPLCTEGELISKIADSLRSILQLWRDRQAEPTEPTIAGDEGGEEPSEKDIPLKNANTPDKELNPIILPAVKPTHSASKISGLGWTGIGVGIAGLGASALGGTFVIRDVQPDPNDPRNRKNYLTPGLAILFSGAGVLVAGIVMIIVDRVQARRYRTKP